MIPTPAARAAERLVTKAVEDQLHGRQVRPGDRCQGLGAGLDRHTVGGDTAVSHHLVERFEHRIVLVDAVRRAVQLDEVQPRGAEVRP
jgi:hypothetical protein